MRITAEGIEMFLSGKHILKGIDLSLNDKEFLGIIGPNGSGKSTFLKCVYRVQKPSSGKIFFNGQAIDELSYRQSALQLAVVAQHNFHSFDFNVLEVVLMGRSPHKKILENDNQEDYVLARKALSTVGLSGFENRNFSTLSGGEQQRVILARALTQETECLILDEPTNHLDIIAREALENALIDYEGTLLVVSHDRYFINKLASKIYRFDKSGATLYNGNYDSYLSNYKLVETEKVAQDSVGKVSYKEKKEREALERKKKNRLAKVEVEIDALECEIKELETLLESEEYATDYLKAMEVVASIEAKKKKLDELYLEWEELG